MSEPVRRKGIELRGWTLFGVGFGFVVIYMAFSPIVAGGIGFRLFFDLLDIAGVVMMIWAIAQGIAVGLPRFGGGEKASGNDRQVLKRQR